MTKLGKDTYKVDMKEKELLKVGVMMVPKIATEICTRKRDFVAQVLLCLIGFC